MIWNEKIECADRAFFDKLTIERLQDLVKRCYENVPFYKKALDNAGVKPEDIKTLADYQKVPFTVKTDLRDNYPYGLFAVPQRDIVRIHGSSGTTGKPIYCRLYKRRPRCMEGMYLTSDIYGGRQRG